jgi:cbb3-type cytochrome oxidase subunit 3
MEEKIINGINGVGLYGVISICIFFGFFTGMLIWAFVQKKKYLNHMAELPLADGEKKSTDKTNPETL